MTQLIFSRNWENGKPAAISSWSLWGGGEGAVWDMGGQFEFHGGTFDHPAPPTQWHVFLLPVQVTPSIHNNILFLDIPSNWYIQFVLCCWTWFFLPFHLCFTWRFLMLSFIALCSSHQILKLKRRKMASANFRKNICTICIVTSHSWLIKWPVCWYPTKGEAPP